MLLDRIDIDSHGPLSHVGIGPFSEQLNVIHTAPGSGKTALVRFLRDSLTGTTPAFAGLAQSSGRVVWSAADGLYHCRREPDGTNQGRRFVDFECRDGGYNAERFNRPAVVTDLPMAVVDGIVTDTVQTSVRRVVQSLLDTGLDRFDTVDAGVTVSQASRAAELAALRSELVRLRDSLRQQGYAGGVANESQWREQLAALTLELEAIDARREFARQSDAAVLQRRQNRDAMQRAVAEVDRLRHQETDLRKRIASLDATLDRLEDQSRREHDLAAITQVAGKRVAWINRQVQALRALLTEVRELGDRWFRSPGLNASAGFEAARDARLRQDRDWAADGPSLGAAAADDRYLSPILSGVSTGAEIESRLERLCQNVDRLVGRLEAEQQHWLDADQTAGELFGEAMSESEQALRRARRRAEARYDQHADAYVDGLAAGSLRRDLDATYDDSGWVEDSVRRQRIDSLHREQRRRRLDDLTDQSAIDGGSIDSSEDALLHTMRSIGTALHSLARRLRGLKSQSQLPLSDSGLTGHSDWVGAGDWSASRLPLAEQTAAVRRCDRELVAALTQLVNHRTALVRRVAAAQTQDIAADAQWLNDAESSTQTAAWADPSLPQIDRLHRANEWADALAALNADAQQTWNVSDDLWRLADARYSQSRHVREATRRRLELDRGRLLSELKQAVDGMNSQLALAEKLRLRLRAIPAVAPSQADEQLRGRIEAEIRRLHHQLAVMPANSQTLARYRQCVLRLRTLEAELPAADAAVSRLSAAASEHLRHLSGGRLNQVQWRLAAAEGSHMAQLDVQIDHRDEQSYSAADRFLAALAVRLAAADELSRRGRPLPLVVETPADFAAHHQFTAGPAGEIWSAGDKPSVASSRQLVTALSEIARRGRQIVLLTTSREIADAAVQSGGRGYGWDGSSYYTQAAVRPASDIGAQSGISDWAFTTNASVVSQPSDTASRSAASGSTSSAAFSSVSHPSMPRDRFDTPVADGVVVDSWHEVTVDLPATGTTATGPTVVRDSAAAAVRQSTSGRRDVVSFPTAERQGSASESHKSGRGGAASGPFFLTVNSPIEQATSIDTLVVARLRELGVLSVGQFLDAASADLAERLQMADVTAAIIRRWQAECRLVSGVRGLRGFDARVLVGCGIVHPREVLEVEPAELVEKIEAFLATERGSNLLRTGSQREVARLTQWLADARLRSSSNRGRDRSFVINRGSSQPPRSERSARREGDRREADSRQASRQPLSQTESTTTEKTLRFYLERKSSVVDAPSIGPRMAERLAALQIVTVDDLLKADPATVAAALQLRRVDQATVRAWQQQATLVCRVPMLRGHDAQLLVAAGITQPERLSQCEPQWLLGQVDPVVKSREGQSILRGSSEPDLVEVTDWIRWAQSQRELKAA